MKTLSLGSLFDGIGGFPLAAQRSGIKTVWASEIDPTCIEITKRHFPRLLHLGDITQIHGGEIPPVDIISFGSPCQDLSSAGAQVGIDGERSGLFHQAIRIIYEMREATNGRYPTFIIWENVNGAFGSNNGNDFRTVLEKITNASISMPSSGRWANAGMVGGCRGGASVAWRQLDSQYWGVPQRRKRIFLVGDFRANRAPQILFECESLLGYVAKSGKERETVAATIIGGIETSSGIDSGKCVVDFGRTADRVYINADTARAITATDGGGGSATGLYLLPTVIDTSHADDVIRVSEICPTLQSRMHKGGNNVLLAEGEPITHPINLQVATRYNKLGEGTGLGVADAGQPAYTLQAAHSHAVFAVYPIRDPSLNQNSNGFIISPEGHPAPTLSTIDRHAIAVCYAPGGHGGFYEGVGTLRASAGKHGSSSANLLVIFQKIAFYVRYALRKLMPLECERLQGFPDCWTKYNATGGVIADTPRYTALGNSLAVPCAERVFRGIVAVTGAAHI